MPKYRRQKVCEPGQSGGRAEEAGKHRGLKRRSRQDDSIKMAEGMKKE